LSLITGAFTGDAEVPAPGTAFRLEVVERLGPDKARVRIKTRLNHYLSVSPGGGVMANSTNPGLWETWTIVGYGVGQPGKVIGFKSWENKYLKQDFIHNQLLVSFRSTPGIPMADFAGDYLQLTIFSSSASWRLNRQ